MNESPDSVSPIADHRRQWRDSLYVYPVIARRSRGLSIGVNLNHDKQCNFACVYCQVDRHKPRPAHEVDLVVLRDELAQALEWAVSGRAWHEARFAATPPAMRRINDIAFSGDGEPTCLANFDAAVATAADAKKRANLPDVKIVVITNATSLETPQVQRALPILDANNGEIWAKLDAGSDEYFRLVDRPAAGITLDGIVAGITSVARGRPIVIQTLWARLRGRAPTAAEVDAYCSRIRQILAAGGQIKLVQTHTVARSPAESYVQAMDNTELDEIAARVRSQVDVPVETFYSG